MQSSDIPGKSQRVFGQTATGTYIRSIPQTTADPAAASFDKGFPPQTFTDEGAGGTPPDGRDVNGILNYLSAWARWFQAGAPVLYDSTFQAAIGGYPFGAIVRSTVNGNVLWRSIADNNVTNPDAAGAGWQFLSFLPATLAEVLAGTVDNRNVTPKTLADGRYVRVTDSLDAVNGYRVYADGHKECWGRVTVNAGDSVTITMPVTHANYIIPVMSCALDSTGRIAVGISSPLLNSFVLTNNGASSSVVDWQTKGS